MRDRGRITRDLLSSAIVPSSVSHTHIWLISMVMLATAALHSTHPRHSPSVTSPLLQNGNAERFFHRTITKLSMHAYSEARPVDHAQPCHGLDL